MPSTSRPSARFQPSLAFVLLGLLLAALWIAGGASRGDVLGQVVVRTVAWAVLIAICVFERQRSPIARPVAWMLGAALILTLVQLIPLPPALWQALPGRALLSQAAAVSNQPQPWRAWSVTPGATANAAASLVVPFALLAVVSGLRPTERQWLPGMALALIILSCLVGLIQFSGVTIDNPLINDTPGQVAGTFANRNHFAMFVALGCLIAPIWAVPPGGAPGWRAPVAVGLLLLFALTILASGSRAGIVLGMLGIVIGMVLARTGIRRTLRRYPNWLRRTLPAGIVAGIVGAVLLSVVAGRAVSIDRILVVDGGQDMRVRGLPVIWSLIRDYFPFGSGFGTFDPVFRIKESLSLLKPTYFNHAHNDWLEVVIDGGLPGALLLLAGVAWWARASIQAWWIEPQREHVAPRLGSAMILLIMVGSAFDYPARTPIMMAVLALAAIWLSDRRGSSALPAAS
jgi:O-antigen ligase